MFVNYNFNTCACTQTQTCPHIYYTQIQSQNSWNSWIDYYWSLRSPKYDYVRPEPLPQLRLKPKYVPPFRQFQKQRFPSRVVTLNRSNHRNHYKRNN